MQAINEAASQMGGSAKMNNSLAKTKWSSFLEASGVSEEKQPLIARLCENQLTWMNNLTEETHIASIGSFERFVFPMIRAVYPNLVAADLVSVQPMESPTSLVFYRDARFGSSKGAVNAGDTMFSSRTGWNDSAGFNYSSETVQDEQIGAGGAAPSGTFAYTPIRPGSLTISYVSGSTGNVESFSDDGVGSWIDNGKGDGIGAGTIDYGTGAFTTAFGTVPAVAPVTVTYQYNSEGNINIPQIDLVLTSAPVVARPRKLRARWSIEAAAQLKAVHGDEAEVELMSDMANEMRIEIDREIINDLLNLALANDGNSALSPLAGPAVPSGGGVMPRTNFVNVAPNSVSLYMHRQSFVYSIIEASNKIFQATRRHGATWIIGGTEVVNIIQGQEGEQFVPAGYDIQGSGVQYVGTLKGQWKIYHDPYMPTNIAIVGYKGTGFLDAGYCYCPWIPFYATPTVYLDDFVGRKGLFTSYAKKPINGLFYNLLEVTLS